MKGEGGGWGCSMSKLLTGDRPITKLTGDWILGVGDGRSGRGVVKAWRKSPFLHIMRPV